MDDFIGHSASTLKDSGRHLERFGGKYLDMTKRGIEDGQKYAEQNVPTATKKLKEAVVRNAKSIQGSIPKSKDRNRKHISGFVERLYGASTLGKLYGPQSVKLLREIAELRQENLITESEYRAKKKELLRRI